MPRDDGILSPLAPRWRALFFWSAPRAPAPTLPVRLRGTLPHLDPLAKPPPAVALWASGQTDLHRQYAPVP